MVVIVRRLAIIAALLLAFVQPCAAQFNGGIGTPGWVGSAGAAAPTYQGPADAAGSSPTVFHSCARVVSAAKASTSTNLCDLYASGNHATLVGTLRGSASGFVDQTAYFTGSLTPSAACAAATGGSCVVGKMYNQVTPGTDDFQNGSTSQYPALTFSGANSLPGVTVNNTTPSFLLTTATVSFTQPYTAAGVFDPTSNNAGGTIIGFTGSSFSMGTTSTANQDNLTSDGSNAITGTAALNSYHSLIGLLNSTSSVLNVDGTETTGNAGTTSISGITMRFGRGSASPNATIMEDAVWSSTLNSTQRAALNTNIHSASNGYNF